jgi:hypothetical protein
MAQSISPATEMLISLYYSESPAVLQRIYTIMQFAKKIQTQITQI